MDTTPRFGDNKNSLLMKIAESISASPSHGDNNVLLLRKICLTLNQSVSGSHSPQPSDSENDLLRKWASLVKEGA